MTVNEAQARNTETQGCFSPNHEDIMMDRRKKRRGSDGRREETLHL